MSRLWSRGTLGGAQSRVCNYAENTSMCYIVLFAHVWLVQDWGARGSEPCYRLAVMM